MGPGMVHGNVGDLRAILSHLKFDFASAHFYPDQGEERLLAWIRDAKSAMLEAGYGFGSIGEYGADGHPRTFWHKILNLLHLWDGDKKQVERIKKIRAALDDPFWDKGIKFYYQILDDPKIDKGKSGYGLFKAKEDGRLVPKPSASIFVGSRV
jgi:hypothetical protein